MIKENAFFSISNQMVSKPLFGAFLQQLPKVSTFAPSKQKTIEAYDTDST